MSDRVRSVKLEIKGIMMNGISADAPQVGCGIEGKEEFWEDMYRLMDSIPREERVLIRTDFNGHVGRRNGGYERVLGTARAEDN